MKKNIIIGAGGHARAVWASVNALKNTQVHAFIDIDFKEEGEKILGVDVIGGLESLEKFSKLDINTYLAIGDNLKRKDVYFYLKDRKFNMPNLIHPSSIVCSSVLMGEANFVGPFAHVGPDVELGNANIVNTFANVEHQASLANFVHCAPGSIICGKSQILDEVFVGANSTIIQNLKIYQGTVIGAGAVINKDIEERGQTFIGIPGKKL